VFGVISLMAGLFQINPIWLFGPYRASEVSSASQPDWYVMFMDGLVRLMPAWQIDIPIGDGYVIPPLFWPAVVGLGALTTVPMFYPFIEARRLKDKSVHNLLQRPRDNPERTGLGAMASQLGSVTVSAVPDEQSGEVGGLQNTGTQLGASIGTALAGAVLIATLTTSVVAGIKDNPAVPAQAKSAAEVQLSGGVPFISDADLEKVLEDAGVPADVATEIKDENADARLAALRTSLSILAGIALLALLFSVRVPREQSASASTV